MNPAYCDDGKNIDIVPIFGFKYGHSLLLSFIMAALQFGITPLAVSNYN